MGKQGLLPGVSAPTPSPLEHLERRHWTWKGERKGPFLEPAPLECLGGTLKVVLHSGKLGPLPRPQMGVKGIPPQLTKSETGPSWPGKRISPSQCSL